MSAVAFETRTNPRIESNAPSIRVVVSGAQRRARPRVVHALIAVAVLVGIVAAQLALSIALSAGAYRIGDLKDQQRSLERVEQSVNERLQVFSSTQHLAGNAVALGMVPGAQQYFIDLGTGTAVAAPGMPDQAACAAGCTMVPNSLTTGLPMATGAAGAKVVGTVAHSTGQAGNVAQAPTPVAASSPLIPAGPANVAEPATPTPSTSIPSPVTH